MHVELEVGAALDHVVEPADLVLVQQADVQHALRQHLHRGVVRIGETRAGLGDGDGRLL